MSRSIELTQLTADVDEELLDHLFKTGVDVMYNDANLAEVKARISRYAELQFGLDTHASIQRLYFVLIPRQPCRLQALVRCQFNFEHFIIDNKLRPELDMKWPRSGGGRDLLDLILGYVSTSRALAIDLTKPTANSPFLIINP